MNAYLRKFFIVIGITLVSAACMKSPNQRAIETERLLAASGFKMRLADTPEKRTHIEALTQRQILVHQSRGKLLYVYVDAEHCQCVYAGSTEAYRRYQKLAREKKLGVEDRRGADEDKAREMDWGDWRFNQSW
jgi:hypothetical protein